MNSPSLHNIQRAIKENIRHSDTSVGEFLNFQGTVPGIERMRVYEEAYPARIWEALKETYEAVQFVLGKEVFLHLSRQYAVTYPSQDYNLSRAGRHLPVFLRTHELMRELPFIADLALLEGLISESFHVPELDCESLTQLSLLNPEQYENLTLRFQPSIKLIESEWPLLDIWNSRKKNASGISIELRNRPQKIIIHKMERVVYCELIDSIRYALLQELLKGQTLSDGVDCISHLDGAPDLGRCFKDWAARHFIVGFEVSAVKK